MATQVLLGVSQSFCLDNATCSIIKVPRQGAVRLDPISGKALLLEKVCKAKCSPDSRQAEAIVAKIFFLTSTVTGIYFSVGKSINLITNFGVGKTKLIMNKWIIDGFLGTEQVNKQMFSKPKLLV